MDISLYTDCAVLMAALGSGFYCLTLRREIKALTGNKKGLTAALTHMADATNAAQSALRELKTQVADEVEALDDKLIEVARARGDVEDVLETADGQVGYQLRRMQEARLVAEQGLMPILQRAEEAVQAASSPAADRLEPREYRRKPPLRARSLHEPTAEDRYQEENPFLKAVHG